MQRKLKTKTELTGSDSPTIGESLEEQTHRAHVRYAAGDEAGTVWFDPRDGRERYSLDRTITMVDFDHMDDRVLRTVVVRPHRPGDAVDGQYCVTQHNAALETFSRFIGSEHVPGLVRVSTVRESEVVDSLEAARDWCRDRVAGYADAPRKDAVRERMEGNNR